MQQVHPLSLLHTHLCYKGCWTSKTTWTYIGWDELSNNASNALTFNANNANFCPDNEIC